MAAVSGDDSDVPPMVIQPPEPYESRMSYPVCGSASADTSAASRMPLQPALA